MSDVSFTVRPASIVGFLGENGAGKSTTIKAIMGLVRKESGSARIGDADHVLQEKPFKRKVGFVDDESHFYASMRVGALLDFASGFYETWDGDRVHRLLSVLDLSVDAFAGRLSKGMRTKLALVLALAHRPLALILDEPSEGLDPRARVVTFDILREERARGTAVLFSTHHLEEVERLADRVVLLHRGRVRADMPLREVVAGGSLERFFLERTGD